MIIKICSGKIYPRKNEQPEMNIPVNVTYKTKMFSGYETAFRGLLLSESSKV